MDYKDIMTIARDYGGVDSGNISFSDTKLLPYANRRYHDLENRIKSIVSSDVFWDRATADFVADQSEYSLPLDAVNILRIEAKYTDDEEYKEYIRGDVRGRESSDNVNLDDDRFYEVHDNNIFFYPTPAEAITEGYIVEYSKSLDDLTATSETADIFPLHNELEARHFVIGIGVAVDILRKREKFDTLALVENDYEREVIKMLKTIRPRSNKYVKATIDLSRGE